MESSTMDFLNDSVFNMFGRTDFVGGIDNEALDFGQLEPFVHMPALNAQNNNGNTSAITLAVTTTTASVASSTATTHGTLPESPPDSGSEPPYSPDLHGLNQIQYHQQHYPHQLDAALHLTEPQNEMHQSTQAMLGLDPHHSMAMNRNNIHRSHGNNVLGLNSDDDFNCLMTDPIFQATVLSQLTPITSPTIVNPSQDPTSTHLINTRKRTMSAYDTSNVIIDFENDQKMVTNCVPNKRSDILPAIKSEPDGSSSLTSVASTSTNASNGAISPPLVAQQQLQQQQSQSQSQTQQSQLQQQQQQQQQQQTNTASSENGSNDSFPMQCIRFLPFLQQNWHVLCDQSLQELPLPHYRVDADKGFNFSNSDDAFVCQKKNHFQVTCHAQLQGATAVFVRTETGLEKIKSFHLHFYGVKLETPTQTIRVEQSQSDRSKKPFHPVPIDLQGCQVSKITVGRLHFSETTSNNMRKKGRPNPEQRFFQLVVGLHAHTHSGNFPVISHGSERIIVRASNPGQFESDVEVCWQRGLTQDSIYTHAGRVGINTDRPDESLVVHGNLKISGHIVQPSDSRAKQEIGELDTSQQLQNVKRIRVVKYRYEPNFAIYSGLTANVPGVHSTHSNRFGKGDAIEHSEVMDVIDTGVIAQEVREVLPDAVQEAGSVILSNGEVIDNFLLVNKDRIYMENIGAVKELCKVTGSLETRIEQLERINSRLVRIKKVGGDKADCLHSTCKFNRYGDDTSEPCSNKMIQMTIVVLVIIMAICLAAISTLYFVEHVKQNDWYHQTFRHYDTGNGIHERHNYRNGTTDNEISPDLAHSRNSPMRNNTAKDNPWIYPKKKNHDTQTLNMTATKVYPLTESKSFDHPNDFGSLDAISNRVVPSALSPPEDLEKEKPFDVEPNARKYNPTIEETNENVIVKKINDTVGQFQSTAVTSEKQKIIEQSEDSYLGSRDHSISDNEFNEVDTNVIIDDGSRTVSNNNKSESDDKSAAQSNEIVGFPNTQQQNHVIFETEFHKEHKIRIPIGHPDNCLLPAASQTNATNDSTNNVSVPNETMLNQNRTTIDAQSQSSNCLSTCILPPAISNNHFASKANSVPDSPDVPEMAIPENVDVIETSTAFRIPTNPITTTTTTKPIPIETNLNPIQTAVITNNNLTQLTQSFDGAASNEKIQTSFETSTQQTDLSLASRMAVQAEQPIEVPPMTSQNPPASSPSQSTLLIRKMMNTEFPFVSQNKTTKTEIANGIKQSSAGDEVEPFLRADAQINPDKFHENDIKINFNKKSQPIGKFDKSIAETAAAAASGPDMESLTKHSDLPSSTMATATNAINPTMRPACFHIYLLIRSETFNTTLGSDEICHNFNVTYNIPLSKYMKENRFELIFVTPSASQWTLCSMKDGSENKANQIQFEARNMNNETHLYPTGVASNAFFDIDIPAYGGFERQLEFHGNFQSTDVNACQSMIAANANSIESVLYKINFYRDCSH